MTQDYQYAKTQRKNSAPFSKWTRCPKMITFCYEEYQNIRDLLSTYKFALVENKNREWYLADNLTDVLTWLKASVNFGYEREKKNRKGKKKNLLSQQIMPERIRNNICI